MKIHQTAKTIITKVELNLVTYNLHYLSVMKQSQLGKEAAPEEETLYVVSLYSKDLSDIELNQESKYIELNLESKYFSDIELLSFKDMYVFFCQILYFSDIFLILN
jgi:hypothetical protein